MLTEQEIESALKIDASELFWKITGSMIECTGDGEKIRAIHEALKSAYEMGHEQGVADNY